MTSYTPDPTFEALVREELTRSVEDTTAPPLGRAVRARVRTHQVVTALGVALIVVFGFAGAVTAWDSIVEREEFVRTASGRLLNTRGAGGTYPCESRDLGHSKRGGPSCIAIGSYNGMGWTLGASISEKRGLCLWTGTSGGGQYAGVAGSSCDSYTAGSIALSSVGMGDDLQLAAGAVPPETEKLYLTHGTDSRFELEIYPTPGDFPLDLEFYLVWLPEDAKALQAVDMRGEIIATRSLDGSDEGDDRPIRSVRIAENRIEGQSWTLEAYGDTIDGVETVCTSLKFGSPEGRGTAGTCHPNLSKEPISSVVEHHPGVAGRAALTGVMTSEITSLELKLTRGSEEQVAILEPPRSIDRELTFFVGFPRTPKGGAIEGVLIGRNSAGRVIARHRI